MFLAVSSLAFAEDCAAPCAGFISSTELQNDWIFSAKPSLLKSNDLSPTNETELYFLPIENLKLATVITSEPVLDRQPGRDRAFSDIGTYVEKLYAQYDFEPVTLKGGKFDPVFGLATNELDGIQATDLVSDYDQDERWAAQASLNFDGLGLSQSLTASIFTSDRTVLSESLFTKRKRLRLSDGGAGNTKGISSAAAVYDICKGAETPECYDEGDLGFRLGFRAQKAGLATQDQIDEDITPKDEFGYLAAVTTRIEMDEMTLRLLGEAVYFSHFESSPDDAFFGTLSASLEKAPMTYMAAYTHQTNFVSGGKDTNQQLADFTVQYKPSEDISFLGEEWKIGAGYSFARNADGENTHTLSLLITIDLEGKLGGASKP